MTTPKVTHRARGKGKGRAGLADACQAALVPRQQRGPDFLRLANGPSARYPKESEEKRLLDAMLLAAPR